MAMKINKQYCIGIDGGGTKTEGIIGDNNGRIVGYVKAETTNIQVKALDDVKNTLVNMIATLRIQAKIDLSDINTIYLSLSGAGRETEKALIKASLAEFENDGINIVIENDAMCALASGTYGDSGIVLIAGTGSIAYSYMKETNELDRVGGWGYIIGDEGSGYDIGKQALSSIMKGYDGRGPATRLTGAIMKHLNLTHETEIIPYIYQNTEMRSDIAALSKIVLKVATKGDNVAKSILDNSIKSLIELVHGAFLYLDKKKYNPPIVLCGGLFSNPMFKEKFISDLKTKLPNSEIIIPNFTPVIGAYILSLIENKQSNMTQTIQQEIKRSWDDLDT